MMLPLPFYYNEKSGINQDGEVITGVPTSLTAVLSVIMNHVKHER